MSNRHIQYAFTAGVVSRKLWGQTVLQKYGFGLESCVNWRISNTGGLVSRGGFIAGTLTALTDDTPFAFVPFTFAYESQSNFGILFTAEKIQFTQSGAFVLEADKAVTAAASTATETTLTCVAHGYAVGDLVEFAGVDVPETLRGQTVRVSATPTANSFAVRQIGLTAGLAWTDAAMAACNAARVYTLATPYSADHIDDLKFSQVRDRITITSLYYFPHTLTRESDGTWTFDSIDTLNNTAPVTSGGVITSSGVGSTGFGIAYAITVVDDEGQESLPYYITSVSVHNIMQALGRITITWNGVPTAIFYNLYRTMIITTGAQINLAQEFGYVGSCSSPTFTDNNIVADYTKMPPRDINPFSSGAIKAVRVLTQGSGYLNTDVMTLTDPNGTDAELFPVISSTGAVGAIIVQGEGKGYTNPSISFTGAGTGATFEFVLREADQHYPLVSTVHQQRAVYGSTLFSPLTIVSSQIGLLNNLSYSRILAANESYDYEFDSSALGYIRHFVPTKYGLLTFTDVGIWNVSGSNGAISPTDIQVDPETNNGCSDLYPLNIDTDIFYLEAGNHVARLLTYNDYTKSYGGKNVSILGGDLIAEPYDLTSWCYASRPFNQITATRDDGTLVMLTLDTEQEVFAWYSAETFGEMKRVIALREPESTVVYAVVKRYLGGRWVYTIEYTADRSRSTDETHCGLDCAIPFGFTYGTGRVTLSEDGETFTSTAADFASTIVGDVIRYRGGKAVVTAVNSSTSVDATVIDAFDALVIPYAKNYSAGKWRQMPAGAWLLSTPVTSVNLPLNFRPEKVSIYADGIAYHNVAVNQTTGEVELPIPATLGWIGLPFSCRAKTLPIALDGALVEASRKNIKAVGIRFVDSKGLQAGTSLDDLYPMDRVPHDVDAERDLLTSAYEKIHVSGDWDTDGGLYIVCDEPVQAEVSALVVLVNFGDAIS